MTDRFEDHRGVIQDILAGPIDQVTEIFTRAGHVRGNHYHEHTTQWTYVVSGSMWVAKDRGGGLVEGRNVVRGELIVEESGVPHAWRANVDTRVLVFTRGPRSGSDYESDVIRLAVPILESK